MMFRRKKRREERQRAQAEASARDRVAHLQRQVGRLERALAQVLDASDDVLVDLRRHEQELDRLSRLTSPTFADAWHRLEVPTHEAERFFAMGQPDLRARKWLLATN